MDMFPRELVLDAALPTVSLGEDAQLFRKTSDIIAKQILKSIFKEKAGHIAIAT